MENSPFELLLIPAVPLATILLAIALSPKKNIPYLKRGFATGISFIGAVLLFVVTLTIKLLPYAVILALAFFFPVFRIPLLVAFGVYLIWRFLKPFRQAAKAYVLWAERH